MILTLQNLVSGSPSGLKHTVSFAHGGTLMQSDYETIGLGEVRRALSNRALRADNPAPKYSVRVTATGWQKPGLDGFDFSGKQRVGFIEPLCQQSDGSAITPVRSARSDLAPYALAVTPSGLVATTLTGWTPAAVAGALYYLVYFYPELDGYARFAGAFDQGAGTYNWTLEFQEA